MYSIVMYYAQNKGCLLSDKIVQREGNPRFEFLCNVNNIIHSGSSRENSSACISLLMIQYMRYY